MSRLGFLTNRWSLKDSAQGSGEPSTKRKEQVRRAQKNYRRRKEDYVKDLEAEVVQLRTSQANFHEQNQKLSAEVRWLRDIIDDNKITLPPAPDFVPESDDDSAPTREATAVQLGNDQLNNRRLIVQRSLPSSLSPESSPPHVGDSCGHTHTVHAGQTRPGLNGSSSPEPGLAAIESSTKSLRINEQPAKSDTGSDRNVVLGMNFILSLEGPCLEHVRGGLQTPKDPHGHALTVTASIFRLSGPQSPASQGDQPLQVSKGTLERLIELSSQLTDDGELTPAQIWAYVCRHPGFATAGYNQIMLLMQSLLGHIKCYGFGAVIPREVALSILSQRLGAGGAEC